MPSSSNLHRVSPAILLFVVALLSRAQQIAVIEHRLPIGPSSATGIANGSDGALWFTEEQTNKIGRYTTGGALTEYPIADRLSGPYDITAGPDGALWFTEDNGSVGRITTGGVITQFPVIPGQNGLTGITTGPDRALWFTSFYASAIYRMTTGGALTSYALPNLNAGPNQIVTGPDGALWFTESYISKIGRITTSGEIVEFPLTANSYPLGITLGPDGALWFTEHVGQKIGRITVSGTITEFPDPQQAPTGITPGPDGALWFTSNSVQEQLGRITTEGAVTPFVVPTESSSPTSIVTGLDGALWFTEFYKGKIGQAVFRTAELSVIPQNPEIADTVTFSGHGFHGGETVNAYSNSTGTNLLFTVIASSTGSFTTSGPERQSPYGRKTVSAIGQTSGKIAVAALEVTPRIKNSPECPLPGCTDVISGYGFGSGESVTLYLASRNFLIGTATADVDGSFSFVFQIPQGAIPGRYLVYGVGSVTEAIGQGYLNIK